MIWEVWEWDGHYIQGKLLKKCESKEGAMKHAKKTIQYKKATRLKKNEIFLEDANQMPIGVLIRRE